MGIYASGQTYEQLILHLLAHPLPEARRYGQMILEAVQAVMPSFVTRVERPDRGGEWIAYLEGRERAADRWVRRLGLDREAEPDARPSVRLLHVDGDEDALLAALLFEAAGVGEEDTRIRLAALSADERTELLSDLVGVRANRRHRPGRGFEALRYRFEVVSDYGAFRDLQRHRMLTVQWQRLTPAPRRRRARGGPGGRLRRPVPPRARRLAQRVGAPGRRRAASARRSTRCASATASATSWTSTRARRCSSSSCAQGARATPSYRAVAHEMHRLIAQVHPAVAGAMTHVDTEAEPRLERILSEMRTQAKIDALSGR